MTARPSIKRRHPPDPSFRDLEICSWVFATLFVVGPWAWMEKRWGERKKSNQKKIAAFKAKLKDIEEAKAKKEKGQK
ncbi:hypothetical protein CFE70_005966 [Pyrenophora teres f. teres 0-1]